MAKKNFDKYLPGLLPNDSVINTEDFALSNSKRSINGYIFNNTLPVELLQGTRVRWYFIAVGLDADTPGHTVSWTGNDVISLGYRTDVILLEPSIMESVDMVPDNLGVWQIYCHVSHHTDFEGMYATYVVKTPKPFYDNWIVGVVIGVITGAILMLIVTGIVIYVMWRRMKAKYVQYEPVDLLSDELPSDTF